MEFYSANTELKKYFGAEIMDADYITELNKICDNAGIGYLDATFLPHNLLLNWNDFVDAELFGDEDTEDFDIDFRRDILFELENNALLKRFDEHQIFIKILESIDKKLKAQIFIPKELENEKRWWNCIVFKKGTIEYINRIENYMFDKFNVKLELKSRIENN